MPVNPSDLKVRGLYRDGRGMPIRVKAINGDRVIVCAALQEGWGSVDPAQAEIDWDQDLAATCARLTPCTPVEITEIEKAMPPALQDAEANEALVPPSPLYTQRVD